MDNLYNIPSQGSFGNIVTSLNANFTIIKDAMGQVEYTTNRCRGMYASSTALGNAIGSPKVGDWALVGPTASGNSYKADIYVCATAGTWTDSGTDYTGDSLNLTNYVTQSSFSEYQGQVGAAINTLNGHFASGGVVAGHTADIMRIDNGVSALNTANGQRIIEINALQDDLNTANTGLKDRMTEAEENIDTIYSGVRDHDTSLVGHEQAIHDLQADVRNIRTAISMIGPGEGGGTGLSIQAMTQDAYNELETYDANTLYIII